MHFHPGAALPVVSSSKMPARGPDSSLTASMSAAVIVDELPVQPSFTRSEQTARGALAGYGAHRTREGARNVLACAKGEKEEMIELRNL